MVTLCPVARYSPINFHLTTGGCSSLRSTPKFEVQALIILLLTSLQIFSLVFHFASRCSLFGDALV